MIPVKDANTGEIMEAASNAKGNVGVTLGAVGTGLGVMGLLGLGGAAVANRNGNGNGNNGSVERDSPVSVFRYFTDRENDNNRMWTMFTQLRDELCALRERAAVNETANSYQNAAIAAGFANVDTRFEFEEKLMDKNLQIALCDVVRGENVLPMSKLGMKLADNLYGVDTYEIRHPRRFRDDDDCRRRPVFGSF